MGEADVFALYAVVSEFLEDALFYGKKVKGKRERKRKKEIISF